ncbi:hypothetical protein CC86DRAFT_7713 [Ophiobolus disseminans]|uniref:Uncharacterized protein n=1 Tax=Ophiobolus disseminans TaxID=1469910 RepID=A0A6A7AKN1_9PLEO|nr:hypothetical protein CC86DRAFT_7713 [Ophiobolus disseminans]
MEFITRTLGPRTTAGLAIFVTYVAICRGLRYVRRDRKHAQFPYKTREDYKKMTTEDAFEIVRYIQGLEFPFMSEKALSFALFKTYGIPSISKLLCETQQLGKAEYAGRRYADTVVLIVEFMGNTPTSERRNAAIARMNYLHGRYQKAGKISNVDLLYTLSLFILEVDRWVGMYEWRSLTDMEICAIGTHWKSIGDAMSIDFSPLHPDPTSFNSGLDFFHAIKAWSNAYETKHMIPHASNHQLAEETTRILLSNVPGPLKPLAKNFVITLMDPRLRKAMLYPEAPQIYRKIINAIFATRRFVSIYLLPPRPYAWRFNIISDAADEHGRYFISAYDAQPWYVKPTFLVRNSPLAWLRWAIGGPYPDGKNYKPQGYKIFEVGPERLEGKGVEECEEILGKLMGSATGGCPFAVGR